MVTLYWSIQLLGNVKEIASLFNADHRDRDGDIPDNLLRALRRLLGPRLARLRRRPGTLEKRQDEEGDQ